MSNVNDLIKERLASHPLPIQRICADVIAQAHHLPAKALETRLEELIRKAVKRGKDAQ